MTSALFFDIDLAAAELSVADWITVGARQGFTFDNAKEIGADAQATGTSAHILLDRKVANGVDTDGDHKNGWIERQTSGWYAQIDLRDFAFERLVQAYMGGWRGRTTLMIGADKQTDFPRGESVGVDGVTVIFNWAAS